MTRVPTAAEFFAMAPGSSSPDLEARFFGRLKMRNGTFKTTRASRFAEIEPLLAPIMKARAAQLRDVLDVGASSGITTVELAQFMDSVGVIARIVATDLFANAHLVKFAGGVTILTDSSGYPLQYDIGGKAIRSWTRRLDYVTLAAIPLAIARKLAAPAAARRIEQSSTQPVKLTSRRFAAQNNISLIENNLMERSQELVGKFDLVRAANILNRDYFPDDLLVKALGNIKAYLRGPGSLLLVTRTADKSRQNSGTLYELGGDGSFHTILNIGTGSEINQLITNLK